MPDNIKQMANTSKSPDIAPARKVSAIETKRMPKQTISPTQKYTRFQKAPIPGKMATSSKYVGIKYTYDDNKVYVSLILPKSVDT